MATGVVVGLGALHARRVRRRRRDFDAVAID